MNTRRIPFQFSTTDPLARQRELEKRFGLQSTCPKMYVDVNNPFSMGTPKETSSPRLQHRVPIFTESYDQPLHSSSVDSMTTVPDKKPNVRVIPIEVEGADRSQRHRTYSGPANTLKDRHDNLTSNRVEGYPFKRFNCEDLSRPSRPKSSAEPRVYNIPIQFEGANNASRNIKVQTAPKPENIVSTGNVCSQSQPSRNIQTALKPKSIAPTGNGCSQSKSTSELKFSKVEELQPEPNRNQADQTKSNVEILLKKIEDVLTEFKTYETGVAEFSGTTKDKQYRYLDEMLTRCMLRLDDIDTMGNEEVRLARKSAVKNIQASIDLLENKANVESTILTEVSQIESTVNENNDKDVKMQDNMKNDNVVGTTAKETGSEMQEMDLKNESKVTLTENTNSTDTEMYEVPQNTSENSSLLKINDKIEDEMQSEETPISSLQQQNNVSEEKQNEISNRTNDVEMLDEKDLTFNSVEKLLPQDETNECKNNLSNSAEVLEVEMAEIGDISSKENVMKGGDVEKTVDHCSDILEQKETDVNPVSPNDAEMVDISNALNNTSETEIDKCTSDLSEQSVNSSQIQNVTNA